jgi:hypothetical protein
MRGGFALNYNNPNNDILKANGFSTSTPIVNSNDGGRTPIVNNLSNPYPSGINYPTGAALGALTFLGRDTAWFDPTFKNPKNWHFSYGFQYQVSRDSTVAIEYVGSRSYDQTMQKAYNIPSLEVRKSCNLLEGGSPVFCQQLLPNPFRGVDAFLGQSDYTATGLARFRLARPFPQFTGDMTQQGRNDSTIWYNSMQVNYNLRLRGDITLLGNYTLSKQVEEWGFDDPYTNVYNRSLYFLDRPHVLKVTPIVQLPFGRGKKFGAGSTGIVQKLISGWEYTAIYTHAFKGAPQNLPGNVIQLKDPRTPLMDAQGNPIKDASGNAVFDGSTDWKAYQPRLWNPCVLRQQNDGSIAPAPNSIALGCGTDWSNNWGNYAWFQTADFAPRFTPQRSGQVRRHTAFTLDMSLLKMTQITERVRFQFGFEAFNAFNHNFFGRDNFNSDPTSTNFGTIRPSTVSTQNMLPRQIQVRLKFFW